MADDDEGGAPSKPGPFDWIKQHKVLSFLTAAGVIVVVIVIKNKLASNNAASTASTATNASTNPGATIGTWTGQGTPPWQGQGQGQGGGQGELGSALTGIQDQLTAIAADLPTPTPPPAPTVSPSSTFNPQTATAAQAAAAGVSGVFQGVSEGQNTTTQTTSYNGQDYYWYGGPISANAPYGTDINGVPLSGPEAWDQGSPSGTPSTGSGTTVGTVTSLANGSGSTGGSPTATEAQLLAQGGLQPGT